MQTKQTTGLRGAATDYVTIVAQASAKISGFEQLYKEMERSISVSGKSRSTLTNYGRQLAHLALYYNCLPTELDKDQVLDYLHSVKTKGKPSATFFKFTVYGMRYACKMRGLSYLQFSCKPTYTTCYYLKSKSKEAYKGRDLFMDSTLA